MGFNLPFIFALFTVAVAVNHAALTPELYWNKVLPGTSMPKAIKESLNPEFMQNKSTSIILRKNGIYDAQEKYGKRYYKKEAPLKVDYNVTLFFLEPDLVPGKTFSLQFTKAVNPASFLPREMADSIPFSSHNITNILKRFLIDPESKEANIMRQTITECEEADMLGEQKYCPTSLESMIDFSTKILGKKNVKAVSAGSHEEKQIQKYKIEASVNCLTGDEGIGAQSIVCHKQAYVYAVFYCHFIKSTKVYMVPLKSENGIEVKAIAVCHEDTSKFNPQNLAFQMTKVKPGTVPICHFIAGDTVVWYRN